MNATEIREWQTVVKDLAVRRAVCMLRQIFLTSNELQGRFEKTICLPEFEPETRSPSSAREALFATICGPLKAGFKHLIQCGGIPSDFAAEAPKNKAVNSEAAALISGRIDSPRGLIAASTPQEASIVSGFRLPSRASSLFSALT